VDSDVFKLHHVGNNFCEVVDIFGDSSVRPFGVMDVGISGGVVFSFWYGDFFNLNDSVLFLN
jgi:hypothetical protein